MTPRIAAASARHLPALLELEREVFPEDAYPREMFVDLLEECGGLFFVARLNRRVAGYVVSCAGRRKAELVSIATSPEYRRAGVGRAMLEHTLDRLRAAGIERFELMVRVKNTAAIGFYESFGFVKLGRVRRYYENGGDALRMGLRIRRA